MGKKLPTGRPELEGQELAQFRAMLRNIDARVKQIEHDCALFALKESIIELLGRISQLEDDQHHRRET